MYELRIYAAVTSRMPQIIEGLRATARSLFPRHGVRPVAFWETSDNEADEQSGVYLLEWTSAAEQRAGWAALRADPEWNAFVAETQRRGPAIARVTSLNLYIIPDMPLAGLVRDLPLPEIVSSSTPPMRLLKNICYRIAQPRVD